MRKTTTALTLSFGLLGLGAAAAATPLIERQETRADQDLSAQVGMQIAAEEMARYTGWQVFLGVVTAFGLLGTLAMTARSLQQTRETLDLARTSSQMQLRAYLFMDEFKKSDIGTENEWLGGWSLNNYGQTPATSVRGWSFMRVVRGQPSRFDIPEPSDADFEAIADVAPTSGIALHCDLRNETDEIKADLYAGRASIVSAAIIQYRDCFNQPHTYRTSEIRYGHNLAQNHFNVDFMHRSPPA